MKDIILVNPPFNSAEFPNLNLGLLKSILTKENFQVKVLYANLYLKRKIDSNLFEELCVMFNYNEIIEFLFSEWAFPEANEKQVIFEKKLRNKNESSINKILDIKNILQKFLDEIINLIIEESPKIVILHNNLKQLTASIAIINEIKKKDQNITTVLFGYNARIPLCEEILKITSSIDYIFDSDPENDITSFCKDIINGKIINSRIIHPSSVANLDILPYPDYTDFYEQLNILWFRYSGQIAFVESSRGCRNKGCIFCGFGNTCKSYIKKSPERLINELIFISKEYNISEIHATDYIMPKNYPKKVFSNLNKLLTLKNIFYEVKPDLTIDELIILKENFVNIIQAGIESLNDNLLKILNKKTTTINNLRFLRDCKSIDIEVYWNFIYGMPNDNRNDYIEIIVDILPYITHLHPPANVRPIFIQKGSPIFEKAKKYGINNLRPYELYNYIFPNNTKIENIALFYHGDYNNAFNDANLKKIFLNKIDLWQKLWKNKNKPVLRVFKNESKYFIEDTRSSIEKKYEINNESLELLKSLSIPKKSNNVDLTMSIQDLLEKKIILKINDQYISLVEINLKEG
ncbi:MAG: hypothetical protein A2Y34_01160 [Spirochaetes bacterium GWC1_27_15]|nr:MAG: hypothetical protein A2Z98_00960 [Spirochaetes bacterium GWB1_27_13]OHD24058.1 MAG: hypothetical protein A2Y34_01160 [Spirochaetes bacterium GWC1_27_15]